MSPALHIPKPDDGAEPASFEPRAWRKSTFSNPSQNCVEFCDLPDGGVALRDSKQGGKGPELHFTGSEWNAFLAGAKTGEFNLPPA